MSTSRSDTQSRRSCSALAAIAGAPAGPMSRRASFVNPRLSPACASRLRPTRGTDGRDASSARQSRRGRPGVSVHGASGTCPFTRPATYAVETWMIRRGVAPAASSASSSRRGPRRFVSNASSTGASNATVAAQWITKSTAVSRAMSSSDRPSPSGAQVAVQRRDLGFERRPVVPRAQRIEGVRAEDAPLRRARRPGRPGFERTSRRTLRPRGARSGSSRRGPSRGTRSRR